PASFVPAGIFIAEKGACWVWCWVKVQFEISILAALALNSSMNESVGLAAEPALMRNSLILIGPTLRTFSDVVSVCVLPFEESVHETLPIRSPLRAATPEVTLKVALTLAPGAMGSAIVATALVVPGMVAAHCLSGTVILNFTPVA